MSVMNLRAYLKKHGLSQSAFAGKIGVTQGAVGHWVTGRHPVTPKWASRIVSKTRGEVTLHDIYPRRRRNGSTA